MSDPKKDDINDNKPEVTEQTNTKQHTSSGVDAHLVTSINRECIAAPQIELIAEEDEDEPEEQQTQTLQTSNVKIEPIKINDVAESSEPTVNQVHQVDKFTLETVQLDSIKPEPIPILDNKIDIPSVMNSATEVPESPNQNNKSSDDNSEATEIRVEEGYATRQMDEFFRQTIAAIKEELTKKLENKNEKGTTGADADYYMNQNNQQNLDEFDDEYESDYSDNDDDYNTDEYENNTTDNDVELEFSQLNNNNTDDVESAAQNKVAVDQNRLHHSQHRSRFNRINRNVLYQHILSVINSRTKRSNRINGWFVLIGCFLNQFIIDGLCYNYATLIDLVRKEFKYESKLISSLPGTFLITFFLLIAPISIFLTKQYGTRRVALIGSFISTISLLISSFLTNIIAFSIFYGIFTGIGIGLIYVPSLIATSKWFLKNRLFANSLTILAACIGSALYPVISELILKKYDLFDSLLILSGVQFNCFVGSMLLKDCQSPFSISRQRIKSMSRKSLQAKSNNNNNNSLNNDDSIEKRKKFTKKNKSPSSAHLLDSDRTNSDHSTFKANLKKKFNGEINHANLIRGLNSKNINNNKISSQNFISNNNRKRLMSDTESTTSASTSTVANYTLKQYWRKFVQTRKTPANTKKNLFHLIAEEKRKTRTLSKTSLEDGFVITTSNNLLAPNDESHVIVSRREKLLQSNLQQSSPANNQHNQSFSSRTASRFFTRVANSLRNLTQHGSSSQHAQNPSSNTNSPMSTINLSKNHLSNMPSSPPAPQQPVVFDLNETNTSSIKSNNISSPSHVNTNIELSPIKNTESNTNLNNNNATTPALIPLMSVFSGPLTESTTTTDTNGNDMLYQTTNNTLLNTNINSSDSNNSSDDDETNSTNNNENDDDDDDDDYNMNELNHPNSLSNRILAGSGAATSSTFGQANKSRYLSYRNSLTNSVRGSLIECSVPEDKEEENNSEGVDGNLSLNEDDGIGPSDSVSYKNRRFSSNNKFSKRKYMQQRQHSLTHSNQQSNNINKNVSPINSSSNNRSKTSRFNVNTASNNTYNTNNTNYRAPNSNHTGAHMINYTNEEHNVGYVSPTLPFIHRFISTIDSSSFYNSPINLESIEYNLRNSFIKKKSRDCYRSDRAYSKYNRDNKLNSVFLDYLAYLISFKLFKNPILLILNFSFFLSIIGICVILMYVSGLAQSQGLTYTQSIYILSLIGLMAGFGRIISTISYKVNESNAKSRIFAYVLTLIINGICVLSSTFLCDTVFSFSMFAIIFGTLFGFNLSLRSLFIYDLIGLEWNDDSLFFYVVFSQSIGVCVGVPIAGLIFDITQSHSNVFYFSGLCLLFSGLILTPGRSYKDIFRKSFDSINKFYLQKKF